jgi:ATP-binding cassette subfamily B protein
MASLLAIDAGTMFKQRLLFGALELDPETVRHKGTGQLLGQVIESSAIERLAIGGALDGALATIEIAFAAVVLALGSGGALHALLLIAWVGLGAWVVRRYLRQRVRWTDQRLGMTHDLVERMVGHRTRLAQEEATRWHEGEDRAVERYVGGSHALDRAALLLSAVARGWLVVGLLGLAPGFARSFDPAHLAVALGGVLLAYRALRRLGPSASQLCAAAIAWRAALPVESQRRLVLDAHELVFRYQERGEPVLRGCSLAVHSGDRVLLEGASGGGKSTLAALLGGLRVPTGGLLLLDGLDRRTLGHAGWRRRVASAPQFHENHVFSGTFAFNLLLGRRWPPEPQDLEAAEALCNDLGLGPLLQRMPAGLQQMVGETGWQLSHGERSRLYVARALLQDAEVVVLDESFAALDPQTLERALTCVLRRARTLIVIAHP